MKLNNIFIKLISGMGRGSKNQASPLNNAKYASSIIIVKACYNFNKYKWEFLSECYFKKVK